MSTMSALLHSKRALVSGASLIVLSLQGPAFGQQAVPTGARRLLPGPGRSKRSSSPQRGARKSLRNVPMAIDVVSANDLTKKQIFDFKDIDKLAPGLELQNTTGRNNTATLRGIAFDPDSGTLPTVDIYFNDVQADAQTLFYRDL